MNTNQPQANRLFDSLFLEFLCNPKHDIDFTTLKSLLNSPLVTIQTHIKDLFKIDTPSSFQSSRKQIPKSPVANSRKPMVIRKSIDSPELTPKKIANSETIPPFYNIIQPEPSKLTKLYPPDHILTVSSLSAILKDELSLPSFFAVPFMISLDAQLIQTRKFEIPYSTFLNFAVPQLENASLQEKIFRIFTMNQNRNYILHTDLVSYIAALLQTHKSLKFLENDTALLSSYTKCIIARIFYTLDFNFRGRIEYRNLANSNFCDCLIAVENAEDISDITDFLSYEHFYVLFTKFWELDTEETGRIDLDTLATYDENRINKNIVKRLFNQLPSHHLENEISFTDFVYFVMAVEDKTSETALRLWFKVCDLDDDGVLSLYEIRRLYSDQKNRMNENGMGPISFKYVLNQILDMVGDSTNGISMNMIRESEKQDSFFNMLIDFKKFNEGEYKDPLFEMNINAAYTGMKTWDVYCQVQYAKLSSAPNDDESFNDDN